MVDNFVIKYSRNNDIQHVLSALQETYTISLDMEGELFFGINLKWDCIKHSLQLSMPDYIRLALEQFQHRHPTTKTDALREWKKPVYGYKQ